MGRVFRRGNIYWIEYWHRGKQYRESSRSARESDARKLLKKRLGEMGLGKLIGPVEERVSFDDLAADYLQDYGLKEERSSRWAKERVKHLQRYFGFVEYSEYLAIREHLPQDYQDVLDFGYYSGWRRGEIFTLE